MVVRGGGGGEGSVNVCAVCAAGLSESLPHYSLFFFANYRRHPSHFLENAILAIPSYSLSIYASTLSTWFQAAECNAVNAGLLLNLINNNFLIFFNRESSHFESLLTPKILKFATPF